MSFKTLTMAEAWYMVNVQGVNPGLSLEQATDTVNKIKAQYSQQIEEASTLNNGLGQRRTFKNYTGS